MAVGEIMPRRDWSESRWDRTFFLVFVIAAWVSVYVGFRGAVTARVQGKADYAAPLIEQVHVAAFAGWMLLLTAQVLLIRLRRAEVHRILG